MLLLVTATRLSPDDFSRSPLGISLKRMAFDDTIKLSLTAQNTCGLPSVYNQAIDRADEDDICVFLHDDLWLDDIFFSGHIQTALNHFDVIGLAGNRRLLTGAPAWHLNESGDWDRETLSGVVCHGPVPFGAPSVYGPTPAAVQLLDGVLLAARRKTLTASGIRFDERFSFHFYDLDFSRQAISAGLTLGTWPIAVTHVSGGNFGSPAWKEGLAAYRQKWG